MDKKVYNLTFPQQNILFMERFNENSSANVITGLVNIKKGFNENSCKKAINEVIEKNIAMRTRVIKDESDFCQYFEEYKYEEIEIIDMSSYSKEQIEEYIDGMASQSLFALESKLYDFKILKYSNNEGSIFMRIHHIISDAWSCSKIGTQLIKYIEKSDENDIEIEELPSYTDFINSENEYKTSEKYTKDREFWNDYLCGINDTVSLKEKGSKVSNEAKRYSVKLGEEFNNRILEYCKENRVSPYALFLAAVSTYIYRIKDKNDFVLGTPVLNRSNFKEKKMLGMFVSTLPLRIKIEENENFLELTKKIGKDTLSVFRHQKYPYMQTLEEIRKNSDIKTNLYNIVLSYQNARTDVVNEEKYSTSWAFSNMLEDELQIHIMDMDDTGILNINYDYKTDLFESIEIEYFHTRIMAIIENAIDDTEVNVENIRIMSKEEENKILYEFNDTKTDYPKDKTVIELFEKQVEKTPDNIALVFEDKTMTYRELNEKANSLAHYLREEKEIQSNDIVALILKRGFDMIISILAVLKSGAAYLPIDPAFPNDRIEYMINNSNAKTVILNVENKDLKNVNIIKYDESIFYNYSKNNIILNRKLNDFAYIIYTSGTTGKPKGVVILQSNLLHICFSAIQYQNLKKLVVFGAFSTYSFDISILEIFIPLILGAKIVVANEEEQKIPQKMGLLLSKNNIEVINMTPTRMKLLLKYDDTKAFSSLKKIMLGGESFPKELFKILRKYCDADIYDGYGPTEITVWSSAKLIDNEKNINIGKPLPNVKSYILDKKNRLLPILIEGELCVGGDGVAYGYYNNEVTNKKFINFNNIRIYKTGDLSSFNILGELNYFGRLDSQIKLNGLRIEIEEIENIVKQFKSISQAAIKVINNKLCLYFTSDKNISINELKEYLIVKLPKYMLPNFYMQIEKFELTTLGKIDKNCLPNIKNSSERKIIEPKTIVQKKIYIELVKILGTENISIDDDFFDIGLDSLNVIELVTKLGAIDINVTYGNIYDYSNIRKLAKYIETKEKIEFDNENINNYDYSKINDLISVNSIDNINNEIETQYVNNILLTGATGFLGIHLLENFLKNENGKVYCVIRRKNNMSAKERLKEGLEFFFGNKFNKYIDDRIIIIDKDISNINDSFNKNEELWKEIASNIDLVIHSAARVKHFGDKENFENINVETTKNIADFCMKYNKKLVLISTLSVSGNMLEGGYVEQTNITKKINYKEDDIFVNQKLNNIYAYTKFLAERYVLELSTKGLNAIVIRVGNITSRYSDGMFQMNINENAFANRLKTVLNIKTIPSNLYDFYLEFSPVDLVADSIIRLIKVKEKFNVVHLFNQNHIKISDFIKFLKNEMNINIKVVSESEFSKLIASYMKNSKKSDDIKGIIIDLDDKNRLNYKTNTIINSDFSIELLSKIGFEWPQIDNVYLKKYFEYLKEVGFLDFKGVKK